VSITNNALAEEMRQTSISFKREANLQVKYKSKPVGNYKPDFIIDSKIIIEIKAVEFIPKSFEQQLVHYLKSTSYKPGLLVNFGKPILEIRRLIWTVNNRENPLLIRENHKSDSCHFCSYIL